MRLGVVAMVLFLVSACGDDASYPTCIGAVRYEGAVYSEVGFTDQQGTRLDSDATFASCQAIKKGVSEALTNNSSPVEVWSLDGYSTDQVVAVKVTDDAWSVLVSSAAPEGVVERMIAAGLLNAGQM